MTRFQRKTHRAREHMLALAREIPAAERRRELRWMPPIPVAIDDYDTLPATMRPVR